MAFGISGVTGPAQTASANPIPELNPANPTAGTPAAKPTPMPVDTMTRSGATTNPNAYHDAIVQLTGDADVTASPTSHSRTATASTPHGAPTQQVTSHSASIAHLAATTHAQATSVSSIDHSTKPNQSVANTSTSAKVAMRVDIAATTAAISRSSAITEGALELNPATAFGTLAGGAVIAGTQGTRPVSREQATAIGEAENEQFGGGTSDHVVSPFSNLKTDQALPTQAELDARSKAAAQLAPQPKAGPAPTAFVARPGGSSTMISPADAPRDIESSYGVSADHPASGSMFAARRDAQTLVPSMPLGVTVQDVNCNKPPESEYDATRREFAGTPKNRFQDGVKADYIKHTATTKPGELSNLGFSAVEIKYMAANGKTPPSDLKVEVHHILPIECGGTNNFDNLTLVRKDVHDYLTEAQKASTQGLEYGKSRPVQLLITEKGTMYPNVPNATKLPQLNIP